MSSEPNRIRPSDLMYVAVGLADVALSALHLPLQRLQAQLRRTDLTDIAGDGRDDLRIRGELAIRRLRPEPHLELLARRALSQRAQGRQNGDSDHA